MKELNVQKDSLKVEDGKVVINSEELANLIQNSELDLMQDEEEGINICFGCKIAS